MKRAASLLLLRAGMLPAQSVVPNPPGPVSCVLYTVRSANPAFKAAATTADVTLFTLRPKVKVAYVVTTYPVVFSDSTGAMTDVSASVGDSSSDTAYTAAYSIGEANPVADDRFQDTVEFKSTSKAARAVKAHFISTGRDFGEINEPIVDATFANPVELTTLNNHGLLTGSHVRIHGTTGQWFVINGLWTITRTGDDTFTIPVSTIGLTGLGGQPQFDATFLVGGTLTIDICTVRIP